MEQNTVTQTNPFALNKPIIRFIGAGETWDFTIADAVEGLQIFGGIGSGKTSGSGRLFALKYLKAGFGGLVLTAKPDEADLWKEYAKLADRTNDLIIISPSQKNYFNFLEYVSSQQTDGRSISQNIVQVLKTVISATDQQSQGHSNDPFWEKSLDMLLLNVIELSQLAYGHSTVETLYHIVQSAPKKRLANDESKKTPSTAFERALDIAQAKVNRQLDEWSETISDTERTAVMADPVIFEQIICDRFEDARTLKYIEEFFKETWQNLADKTRSIVELSFSSFLARLLKEPVYSLFCKHKSTVTPEDSMNGKVVVIDLSVKNYHEVGVQSQMMAKYIWQRALESRPKSDDMRPVFIFADESHMFVHSLDADVQTTARSSRISSVYITQSISNYQFSIGSQRPEERVLSLLGNMGTQIFHANLNAPTNDYASKLFGEAYAERKSRTTTQAGTFSASQNLSYELLRIVRPEDFVRLKNGGLRNNFFVEAYLHRHGNPFKTGLNFTKVTFNQNFCPH